MSDNKKKKNLKNKDAFKGYQIYPCRNPGLNFVQIDYKLRS